MQGHAEQRAKSITQWDTVFVFVSATLMGFFTGCTNKTCKIFVKVAQKCGTNLTYAARLHNLRRHGTTIKKASDYGLQQRSRLFYRCLQSYFATLIRARNSPLSSSYCQSRALRPPSVNDLGLSRKRATTFLSTRLTRTRGLHR